MKYVILVTLLVLLTGCTAATQGCIPDNVCTLNEKFIGNCDDCKPDFTLSEDDIWSHAYRDGETYQIDVSYCIAGGMDYQGELESIVRLYDTDTQTLLLEKENNRYVSFDRDDIDFDLSIDVSELNVRQQSFFEIVRDDDERTCMWTTLSVPEPNDKYEVSVELNPYGTTTEKNYNNNIASTPVFSEPPVYHPYLITDSFGGFELRSISDYEYTFLPNQEYNFADYYGYYYNENADYPYNWLDAGVVVSNPQRVLDDIMWEAEWLIEEGAVGQFSKTDYGTVLYLVRPHGDNDYRYTLTWTSNDMLVRLAGIFPPNDDGLTAAFESYLERYPSDLEEFDLPDQPEPPQPKEYEWVDEGELIALGEETFYGKLTEEQKFSIVVDFIDDDAFVELETSDGNFGVYPGETFTVEGIDFVLTTVDDQVEVMVGATSQSLDFVVNDDDVWMTAQEPNEFYLEYEKDQTVIASYQQMENFDYNGETYEVTIKLANAEEQSVSVQVTTANGESEEQTLTEGQSVTVNGVNLYVRDVFIADIPEPSAAAAIVYGDYEPVGKTFIYDGDVYNMYLSGVNNVTGEVTITINGDSVDLSEGKEARVGGLRISANDVFVTNIPFAYAAASIEIVERSPVDYKLFENVDQQPVFAKDWATSVVQQTTTLGGTNRLQEGDHFIITVNDVSYVLALADIDINDQEVSFETASGTDFTIDVGDPILSSPYVVERIVLQGGQRYIELSIPAGDVIWDRRRTVAPFIESGVAKVVVDTLSGNQIQASTELQFEDEQVTLGDFDRIAMFEDFRYYYDGNIIVRIDEDNQQARVSYYKQN